MIEFIENNLTYLRYDNSLRAVHLHIPRKTVSVCGVAILAGSRHEDIANGQEGLAHFVEHTIFKGTEHRSSYHIINRMEAVGGELNAFTSKDDTVVYTIFPHGNLSRGLELIADLVINSRFPKDQIDKERSVVADEINSYLDSPADAICDDYEDLIFSGTSLGHNILGTPKSLRKLDTQACRQWIEQYYTPQRMVVFYAGATCVKRFDEAVQRYFNNDFHNASSGIPAREDMIKGHAFDVTRRIRGNHQTHTIMGHTFPADDARKRTAVALLTNILGGPGMNSLLNVQLRERRGLVYTVEATTSLFDTTGLFTIYFGCDPQDADNCRQLVDRQLQTSAATPMSPRALAAAKKQYLGQMTIAGDNMENRIISIARATLMRGRALTDAQVADLVYNITSTDLTEAAAFLLPSSVLTFTP